MGFFKTPEEKERVRQEKLKAIQEKQDAELQKFLQKYSLDKLSDPNDLEILRKIYYEMKGTGLMKFGLSLSAKSEDTCKISHLSALMHQNWLMINQLSRISNSLEKLVQMQEEKE